MDQFRVRFRKSIAFKSFFGIVALLFVFAVIVSYIGYRGFTEELLDQYADSAFRTAHTAADMVDGNRFGKYIESGGKTVFYENTWTALRKICNSSGSTFVYVIQPDLTDYNHITFIFSTINNNSPYEVFDFGYVRETTNDDYRTKYRKLYEGASKEELVIRDKGYISTDPHITAMVPVKNNAGETQAILCVQRQMDALTHARNTFLRNVLAVMAVILLLVIFGQGYMLNKMLIRPVREITREASRFARETVKREQKLTDTIRNEDEVGILAASIDQMEEQIQTYVRDLTHITAERQRISTELSLATRIQADMLPNVFPAFPDRHEFDIFATMTPAKEVGGDFYNFFLIDDDHLCLMIADVSGKDIPAALFMMVSMIILSNQAMLGVSPAEILENANEAICTNNREEMFVTAWLAIYEISTGKLTAANAGHEYPAIRKPGGRFELLKDKHGFVIGGMAGVKYREYELTLEPGSGLFVYTDGVAEATDPENNLFGTQRMLDALNEKPDGSPEELLGAVRRSVDAFAGGAEQFDDLTMLCLNTKK